MGESLNQFLNEMAVQLESESNAKIKKGMDLFMRSDNFSRRVFFHATGFRGEVTAKNLREHFEFLELIDSIDVVIMDMEGNLE